MPTPYPLKPIVTNHPLLPALYDDHPGSIGLISACLTPQALSDLLDQGATFDTVLFLNGDGQALRQRLLPALDDDEALHPMVDALALEQIDERSVPTIHAALGSRRSRGFFSMGG